MARRTFRQRKETFGFDDGRLWAEPALRLLFSVPRAYAPLVAAWETRFPGTRRAMDRLVADGWVDHQPDIVMNTRTAELASTRTRPVTRWRTTSKGRRFADDVEADLRVLEDRFPQLTPENAQGVAALLLALNLRGSHAKTGLSATHAVELSKLAERTGRWWILHLEKHGLLRRLPDATPDTRTVVPAHWRITRQLCRQLDELVDEYPDHAPPTLRAEWRLSRNRFLADIDPARVGIAGATDFDHDVEAQQVLGELVRSPRFRTDAIFNVEPRVTIGAVGDGDRWEFDLAGTTPVFYQPDAEFRERLDGGRTGRAVLEYERFQTRRDAWSHIERFVGWMHCSALPSETGILRFVVDGRRRLRTYVELIEAYADWAIDHPDRIAANPVILAVSDVATLRRAPDALDPKAWFRIEVPDTGGADTVRRPTLHRPELSPYDDYFARRSPTAPAAGASTFAETA